MQRDVVTVEKFYTEHSGNLELNLLAGASPIAFRDYFWASAIGMIPGTVLFAFLGDALWHPASPRFFVAIAMILVCFASGETYRRWKTSDQTDL